MNGALRSFPLVMLAFVAGCAANFTPKPMDDVPFLERAQTQEYDGVRITAAVPDAKESRDLFGIALYKRGVQPVWIEIENASDEVVTFMPASIDSDYHSALEVASLHRSRSSRETIEGYFLNARIGFGILPGEVRSGFVFTNLDEGSKAFNVDVAGNDRSWRFTFFMQVPGLKIDHYDVDFDAIYPAERIVDYTDEDAFIAALEALPCCTTDAGAKGSGDPLNLVMIGDSVDIYISGSCIETCRTRADPGQVLR